MSITQCGQGTRSQSFQALFQPWYAPCHIIYPFDASKIMFPKYWVERFLTFCPDVPQHCGLCKPFSTCFRPVFRPNSLFCRRCWLIFAMVCSTGGNDAAPRPPESTPTQNVQKKGENSDLSPFSPVFGLFFALPPFLAVAAGLPLQWFARQMKKTPHRDHSKAPRRRMCRKKVRNLQTSDFTVFQSYPVWQQTM